MLIAVVKCSISKKKFIMKSNVKIATIFCPILSPEFLWIYIFHLNNIEIAKLFFFCVIKPLESAILLGLQSFKFLGQNGTKTLKKLQF